MTTPDPYGQQPADRPPADALPNVGYQAVDPLTGQPLSAAGGPDYLGYSGGQTPQGQIPQGQVPPGYLPAAQPPSQPLPPVAAQPPVYPPGYVPGGQVPAGYPAQPVYAGQPGYPVYQPGYPPMPGYGYPLMPVGPRRPGAVTAAAVLAFIQGGLALIGGVTTLSGASEVYGTFRADQLGSEFTMVAVGMLLAGALLIAGGAIVLNRKPVVLIIGCLISLAVSVYLVVRLLNVPFGSAVIWLPIMYAVLPIISASLVAGTDAKSWARRN